MGIVGIGGMAGASAGLTTAGVVSAGAIPIGCALGASITYGAVARQRTKHRTKANHDKFYWINTVGKGRQKKHRLDKLSLYRNIRNTTSPHFIGAIVEDRFNSKIAVCNRNPDPADFDRPGSNFKHFSIPSRTHIQVLGFKKNSHNSTDFYQKVTVVWNNVYTYEHGKLRGTDEHHKNQVIGKDLEGLPSIKATYKQEDDKEVLKPGNFVRVLAYQKCKNNMGMDSSGDKWYVQKLRVKTEKGNSKVVSQINKIGGIYLIERRQFIHQAEVLLSPKIRESLKIQPGLPKEALAREIKKRDGAETHLKGAGVRGHLSYEMIGNIKLKKLNLYGHDAYVKGFGIPKYGELYDHATARKKNPENATPCEEGAHCIYCLMKSKTSEQKEADLKAAIEGGAGKSKKDSKKTEDSKKSKASNEPKDSEKSEGDSKKSPT